MKRQILEMTITLQHEDSAKREVLLETENKVIKIVQ